MADREVGGRVPGGALALVVLLAAAVRVAALWRGAVVDSDEAIVGLMARHIVEGRDFPLYYYGQNYLGALEAWCAAGVFWMFGSSAFALKAVPAVFSMGAVALVAVLGTRLFSARTGLFAALLFALPPSGLLAWSLKARGGFMEVVAIGTGALILAEDVLFRGGNRRTAFFLGLVLGLGWWVNQQILYYAAPVVLWAIWLGRRDALVREWIAPLAASAVLSWLAAALVRPPVLAGRLALAAGLLATAGVAAFFLRRRGAPARILVLLPVGLLAALADDLPGAWSDHGVVGRVAVGCIVTAAAVWSAATTPRRLRPALLGGFATFLVAFSWWNAQTLLYATVAAAPLVVLGFGDLVAHPLLAMAAIGALLGSVPFWIFLGRSGAAAVDVVQGARLTDVGRHVAGFLDTSLPMLLGARPFWGTFDYVPFLSLPVVALYLGAAAWSVSAASIDRRRLTFLATFLLGVPVIFIASRFGWFAREPRYLLPIYSGLFLVPALAADGLWRNRRPLAAASVVVTLLLVHANGILRTGRSAGLADLSETERVSADHDELIRFLDAHGIDRIYTNYWIGYRLAFETGERVLFAPLFHPFVERIPAYGRAVRRAENIACVLAPSHATLIADALRATGVAFRSTVASHYVVLHDVQRPEGAAGIRRLPLVATQLAASGSVPELGAVVDGDLGTRWATHLPQAPGQWLELRFDEPRPVSWLTLSQGDFVHDTPRGLRISLAGVPGASPETLVDSDVVHGLTFWAQSGRVDLNLGGRTASRIRIEQTGRDAVFDWSIAELSVYVPDEPGPGAPP